MRAADGRMMTLPGAKRELSPNVVRDSLRRIGDHAISGLPSLLRERGGASCRA